MPGTPHLENPEARELLRGFEKELFALVADGSDKRFEWLMPVMKGLVLRDKEAKERANLGLQEADSSTEDGDQDTNIQPPRPGAFEDQMFDCAAEGIDVEWRDFLRIPIEAAAFVGRQDLVERLRLAGAPTDCVMVEATRGGHVQFVSDMSLLFRLRTHYRCGGTDKDGNTALHIAARDGREQIARTLLLAGANTRAFNRFGDAPLHVAAKHGQLSVARALLLAGADARLKQLTQDDVVWDDSMWEHMLGNCPLKLAVSSGENRLAMMELLLRHGADVDDGEEYAFTAMFTAADKDALDAVNFLLAAGASVQDDDCMDCYSAITLAAIASNVDMALSLLRHGSRPNVDEQDGETTLKIAAASCPEMLDLLLRWGADEKVLSDWNGSPGLTAKEERRVRKLLANASQDRAWRRRGLPVLCRAFPDRCLLEQEHPKDSTQARAVWIEPVPIPRKRQKLTSRLVFESRSTKTRGVKDLGSSVDDGEGTGERTSNDAPEFSRLTARLLLTLQEENVFRHVVEYL